MPSSSTSTRTAAFLQTIARRADAHEIESQRMRLIEESYGLFPDVLGCLERLRRTGLVLGVITNSEPAHQRRKLAAVGLADAFDAVVISGEVGVAKPERAIFRARLRRGRCRPRRVTWQAANRSRGAVDFETVRGVR